MPLNFVVSGKNRIINLNNYRNWHYQTSNKIKKMYKSVAVAKILSKKTIKANKVSVTYTLFRPDKRKFDLMNILSIHDKFFMDAYTSTGLIPDDNINHLEEIKFKFGGYDKNNPRVEIEILKIS